MTSTTNATRWSLVCVLIFSGCIFNTRDPESGITEICFEAIATPTFNETFTNLDGAMECRLGNTYLDHISENFEYEPSPSVPGFPTPWGRTEEENFINSLFSDASEISSSLRDVDVSPPSGTDPVVVEATYVVDVTIGGSSTRYEGDAFFTLSQEASRWVITRWEEKAADSPLSLLRQGIGGS